MGFIKALGCNFGCTRGVATMDGNRNLEMGDSLSNVGQQQKRVYQGWRKGNKFLFGVRMIFGPDIASLLLTTFLIVAPAIAFCVKVYLQIKKNDDFSHEFWFPVVVVGAVLTVLDLIFLLITNVIDPGIVPRNSRPLEFDDTFDIHTSSMESINLIAPHMKLAPTKDVVNGYIEKVEFCDTCLLYRPLSTTHCTICNNCIEGYDHHCGGVGRCIGRRNYRYFVMFILTSTILCLYVLVFTCISVSRQNVWRTISHDYLADFLIVYCFIAGWFLGVLSIFHSYLICTNQTCYELKRRKGGESLPHRYTSPRTEVPVGSSKKEVIKEEVHLRDTDTIRYEPNYIRD